MSLRAFTFVFLAALALCGGLAVHAAPPSTVERTRVEPVQPEPEQRTLVANKFLNVTKTPLYFKLLSVTVFAKQTVTASGAETVIYQLTGTTEVVLGRQKKKTLKAGDALLIIAGQKADLKTGAGPSAFVTFNLVAEADLERPLISTPSIVTELFRSPTALPGLEPGRYDLDFTEVTLPASMALDAPHHRSGAALYYVTAGIGLSAIPGTKTTEAPVGKIVYTPAGLVHQWGNQRDTPTKFVVFNLNPLGTPAVKPGDPTTRPASR